MSIPEARVVTPNILVRFFNAIIGSKKAVAAIATVIFTFLVPWLDKLGITVTETELEKVIGVAIAYLVGQGVADAGKEAAKIKANANGANDAPPAAGGAPGTTTTEISGELDT